MVSHTETTIVLVRHGHVPGIEPPSFRGRVDLPLTDLGLRQAALTGHYLATHVRPSVAYASPLSRCMRTAEAIVRPDRVPVSPLPDFVDIDYGDWQGKTFDEVRGQAASAFSDWMLRPQLAAIPNGETLHGVGARVARVMRHLLVRHQGETVLLVGHESVNRVFLLLALELPLSRYWQLCQDPCAVNLLTYADRGWTVRCVNETAHLASLGDVA
jgi:broad specificity phosphatase PhoE